MVIKSHRVTLVQPLMMILLFLTRSMVRPDYDVLQLFMNFTTVPSKTIHISLYIIVKFMAYIQYP